MEKRKVSIIMPVYNGQAHLCECINSVLKQTYHNFEFIIIDDGSTDLTKDIILSYHEEKRIKPIFLKQNNQICNALNEGLKVAQGDYIARIDCDDLWNMHKLEKQITFLENNEQYDICFTYVNIIDAYGNSINEQEHALYDLFNGENLSQKEWLDIFLRVGNRLSHPSVVFSRKIVEEVGMYHYLSLQSQDYDYWLRIIVQYPIYVYPEILVNYRWDENPIKISQSGEEQDNRFMNEVFLSKLHFFETLDAQALHACFKEQLVDTEYHSDLELLIEKALLLLYKYQDNADLTMIGLILLSRALWDTEAVGILEKKGYLLKDIYKCSSKSIFVNPSIVEKSNQFETLHNEIGRLRHENALMHQRNIELSQELIETVSSSSWKMTAPIRNIKSKLGKHKQTITSHREARIYLLGTENYGNLGDHEIAISERKFLAHYFPTTEVIEVPATEYFNNREVLLQEIQRQDIIIGHGGGNLGNQYPYAESIRRDFIQSFLDNKIIIFPQTIYFTKDAGRELQITKEIYDKHKRLLVVAREKSSYTLGAALFGKDKVLLNPDIVLFNEGRSLQKVCDVATLILRGDIEKTLLEDDRKEIVEHLRAHNLAIRMTDTQKDYHFGADRRNQEVESFLTYISHSRLLVTDRLHGMVFAALIGMPCIVFSNYNDKVRGTYEWIKNLEYIKFIESIDAFPEALRQVLEVDIQPYNREALMSYYNTLSTHIKNEM